ncbi:MAG: von Willebrand factor type A domain-containing protein, partial [Akkermansiaceae bacterium]|nr:von Willebrand factor type A domain-containing protein [Akkermansiaceae bacterium]
MEGSEFSLAQGLRDLGRLDSAEKEFKKALQKDPASKEARRGLARIASEKSYYYRSSYDETRARMLQEVDKTWELAIPSGDAQAVVEDFKEDDQEIDLEAIPLYTADDESGVKRRGIAAKLQNIILPEVDLNNVTVEEAMALLEQGALAHDPDGEGLTLDVRKPRVIEGGAVAGGGLLEEVIDPGAIKIDKLHLKNVPLQVAAQYVADKAKLKYRVDEGKVTFLPLTSSETADIVTRRFEVPENFGAFLSSNGDAAGSDDDSFATLKDNGGSGIKARQSIVDLLKRQGVVFIDGTSASLLTDSGSLVVRNTPSQLELVDAILAASVQDAEKKKAEKEARKLAQQKRVNFETLTTEKSDSTFSLNVSDVSFKLAKSSLSQGKWPEAAKVRPEGFVNALNYDDRKPSQSEKVACEIEQGTHPFMQQRNLMRVSMSTAALGRNASTPLRLTILLDQSGSMERADRAESVKRAFALLTDQLNIDDEITLVGFARTPRLLAERVKGNESKKLLEIVSQPITEGGTNLEGALDSGIQLAKQQFVDGAQNRIILLTDGAANLGDALPANLAKQVEKMRQAGIAFDACGVGADGLNDEVLSSLAKQGDGRYYFLDRPEDADDGFARQIAGALRPAAKNVKVQVIFNPRRVSKFKLYGFEKHLLKKEDFRNDTVDAAEMAAEESGVALY